MERNENILTFSFLARACLCAKLPQACLTLCNPMNCSLPSSSVYGILQARILEWIALPSSRDPPDPGITPTCLASPALAGRLFTTSSFLTSSEGASYFLLIRSNQQRCHQ